MLPGLCTLLLLLAPAAAPASRRDYRRRCTRQRCRFRAHGPCPSKAAAGFLGPAIRFRVAGDGSSSVSWHFRRLPRRAPTSCRSLEQAARTGRQCLLRRDTFAWSTSVSAVDQGRTASEWQSLGTFGFRPDADEHVHCRQSRWHRDRRRVRWVAATPRQVVAGFKFADPRFFEQTRYRSSATLLGFFQKRRRAELRLSGES